jgi:Tfp pilus assembly protein PilP
MTRSIQLSSRGSRRLAAAGLLSGLLLWAAVPPPAAVAQDSGAAGYNEPAGSDDDLGVDDILAGEEEMLANEGYNYDPGNRRDPFRSLQATRDVPRLQGPRPEGIPGLLVDELDLTGIFITGEGPVAQVLAANKNESHLLRVGDRLFDGDVVSISRNEIVFRQVVDDPTAIKPFREVVKKLNP